MRHAGQGETESFVAAQAQGPSTLVSPVPLAGLVVVIPLVYSLCFTLVQYGAALGGRVSLDLGESLSSKYALNMQLGKKRFQSNNFSCAVGSVQESGRCLLSLVVAPYTKQVSLTRRHPLSSLRDVWQEFIREICRCATIAVQSEYTPLRMHMIREEAAWSPRAVHLRL